MTCLLRVQENNENMALLDRSVESVRIENEDQVRTRMGSSPNIAKETPRASIRSASLIRMKASLFDRSEDAYCVIRRVNLSTEFTSSG